MIGSSLGRYSFKNNDDYKYLKIISCGKEVEDIFYFKLNISNKGLFIAGFDKNILDENDKNHLINELKNISLDQSNNQIECKIINIVKLFDEYKPIYCSLISLDKDMQINQFLNMENIDVPFIIFEGNNGEKKTSNLTKNSVNKIFDLDLLFISVAALFITFSLFVGITLISSGKIYGIFLLILFIIYYLFLGSSCNDYKKENMHNKIKPIIYITAGNLLGFLAGFLINTLAFKIESNLCFVIFGILLPLSIPACIASNYIFLKIKGLRKANKK